MSAAADAHQATLSYYASHAAAFVQDTLAVDFSSLQELFLSYLPAHAAILDLGCGSGRDARYFLEHGHAVTAVDGSPELAASASQYIGMPVQTMLFQDFHADACYDGIWACASILHLLPEELPDMFCRMRDALKPGGIMYTSFKYGEFSGMRHGRFFTDMTEESVERLLQDVGGLAIIKSMHTGDVRAGRGHEPWLNLILKKQT